MRMKNKILPLVILVLLTSLIVIPLISAFWGTGFYRSPIDYLDNEWVRFTAIMIIFFGIIFYTVNKTFKNRAVAAGIALGLSLLIAIALARRGLLYGYVGDAIGTWIMVITALIGCGFLIKFAYDSFKGLGALLAVAAIWALIHFTDPYSYLPYSITGSNFMGFYEFMTGWLGLIILLMITFAIAKKYEEKSVFGQIKKGARDLFSRN